jgi:hypothetical protein
MASIFLLVLVSLRKHYQTHPAFTFYIFVNLALGMSQFLIYRLWGYSSKGYWLYAWGMQVVVLCARALAVTEISKHVLARYRGIWELAKRILLVCAGLVLLYAGLAARHRWELSLPNADRALELAIATVIVLLFVFTRYYDLRVNRTDRLLAIGFCLYSCFRALNDTILERFLYGYSNVWGLLGSLAFLASLCLWSWALWKPRTMPVDENQLLPPGAYESITPQINRRLRELNDQLSGIWKAEATHH